MDTSVSMTVGAEMNVVSHLEPDDFAHRVLELMPSDVKSADLGCGRILTDWSILLQTRYVLCDIYEDGVEEVGHPTDVASESSDSTGIPSNNRDSSLTPKEAKLWKYRIEIKSGKKTSRIGDAVYCFLFIVIFWFLSRWTTQGFNPLFLIISGLAVLAALYLIWNSTRSKFGPKESAAIAEVLNDSLSCTPR